MGKTAGEDDDTQRGSEEMLERSLKAALGERSWGGNRVLPKWAQAGLARDLARQGRQEARMEKDAVRKMDKIDIDYSPSMSPKDLRRLAHKERERAKVKKFMAGFGFRAKPTRDEVNVALAVGGKMPGVRAFVAQIYRKDAATITPKKPNPVHMETGDGARISFDPSSPLNLLQTDPLRARIFDGASVAENTLYNRGICSPAPTDKRPNPTKSAPNRPRIHFAQTFLTEYYDPNQPDNRNLTTREPHKLITDRNPAPMPLMPRPDPPAASSASSNSTVSPPKVSAGAAKSGPHPPKPAK